MQEFKINQDIHIRIILGEGSYVSLSMFCSYSFQVALKQRAHRHVLH